MTAGNILRGLLFITCVGGLISGESEDLELYVRQNPDDLKSVYKLGVLLIKEGKPAQALKYLSHLRRQKPDSGSVLYAVARANYSLGRIPDALRACSQVKDSEGRDRCKELDSKAREEFPDNYDLYRAQELFYEKKYDESLEVLQELLISEESNPNYRMMLGKIYHVRRKYDYAWDQYQIALKGSVDGPEIKQLISRLKTIGVKALEFVNKTKTSIEDEALFFDRFYYALKLNSSETRLRAGGFTTRAITYLNEFGSEMDPFDFNYRLGFFYAQNSEFELAKETFNKALDEQPDDYLYVTVEFLIEELEKISEKEDKVIDLVSSVGGEEAYAMLQKAAIQADELNRQTQEKNSSQEPKQSFANKVGMSKAQFVAEFDNYRRKLENASGADRNRLVEEMKSRYAHLLNDPNAKKQLEKILKSTEGARLKEQYKDKVDQYKEVLNQYR